MYRSEDRPVFCTQCGYQLLHLGECCPQCFPPFVRVEPVRKPLPNGAPKC